MKNAKPSWLVTPCPLWCNSDHENQEHPDDRMHHRWEFVSVELSTADLIKVGTDNDGSPMYDAPELTVDLMQYWREVEPRVMVNQETGWPTAHELTLDEAEELAGGLLAAVRAARGEDQ